MPFTPSHAAGALPVAALARRLSVGVPTSALVVGTLSPDFDHLLKADLAGSWSHTTEGLFLYCLPLGLAAWALWRRLIAPEAARLLPAGMRPVAPAPANLRLVLVAAAAILVGAFTHQAWDAFTHEGRWGAVAVSGVAPEFTSLGAGPFRGPHFLQAASSVVGGLVVAAWIVARVAGTPPERRRFAKGEARRLVAATAAAVVAALLGAAAVVVFGEPRSLHGTLARASVGAMDGLVLAAVLGAAISRATRPR